MIAGHGWLGCGIVPLGVQAGVVMTSDQWLALDAGLRGLPDWHRLVIELRFLTQPRMTLKQVGERLAVSY
jgi:hypothetical protein